MPQLPTCLHRVGQVVVGGCPGELLQLAGAEVEHAAGRRLLQRPLQAPVRRRAAAVILDRRRRAELGEKRRTSRLRSQRRHRVPARFPCVGWIRGTSTSQRAASCRASRQLPPRFTPTRLAAASSVEERRTKGLPVTTFQNKLAVSRTLLRKNMAKL